MDLAVDGPGGWTWGVDLGGGGGGGVTRGGGGPGSGTWRGWTWLVGVPKAQNAALYISYCEERRKYQGYAHLPSFKVVL